MTEKKQPTAAEQARRELQAAKDTGEGLESVTLDIYGVELTVGAESFDDFEIQEAMLTAADDMADDVDSARAAMTLFSRLTGRKKKAILAAMRNEQGRVPAEDIGKVLEQITSAVFPNR